MKIYLDACCLSRLTDDQTQPRIREEADAIERVLGLVQNGTAELIASEALEDEIRRNPSAERRLGNEALIALASVTVEIGPDIVRRALQLVSAGYGSFDALHLAAAESAEADVLLSTDDRFIKRAARQSGLLRVRVRNPGILVEGTATMIALDKLTDEEFERHALGVLQRELGADGLARFLRLHRSGNGDYTRDRHDWQKGLTVDDILESIRQRRA